MSFISIKSAKVTRIIDGKGFEVVESYMKRDGSVEETKWVVWSDQAAPAVGALVNVSGGFTHKHNPEKCSEYDCSLSLRLFKLEPVMDSTPF